jgi:hypothetical protein
MASNAAGTTMAILPKQTGEVKNNQRALEQQGTTSRMTIHKSQLQCSKRDYQVAILDLGVPSPDEAPQPGRGHGTQNRANSRACPVIRLKRIYNF